MDKATGGKVGYIYVQSTGTDAQNELMRQFMAQWKKDGLIIDERWNSGGQIPDRFIELLHRPIVAYWAVRDAPPPAVAAGGAPGRAGDADQRLERIGRRCVSVLLPPGGPRSAHRHAHVGRADRHQRRARRWSTAAASRCRRSACSIRRAQWFAEGHGVDPDIVVDDDPAQLAKGTDPQLERAIQEVMARINAQPKRPPQPPYEKRVPAR